MRTIVPFGVAEPKTRLESVLGPEERRTFALAMLRDILDAVTTAGGDPAILADAPIETEAVGVDVPVIVDDAPLTAAISGHVTEALTETGGVAVVMADLAIATPASIDRLFAASADVDLAIAPGIGGGTNALVVQDPTFTFDYHGASIRDHLAAAREAGLSVEEVDSFRLAVDVDEPIDFAEVLLHGQGRAATYLRELGFEIETQDGRVSVRRTTNGT